MPLLTKTEYAVLTRAESEAKAALGMHTGGPHEQEYRDFLKSLRRVMLKVKHGDSMHEKIVRLRRAVRKLGIPFDSTDPMPR